MTSPVWIDGPLAGQEYEVPPAAIDEGMFRYSPEAVYTFTLVHLFERVVVTASVTGTIPSPETLFRTLLTPAAIRAAQ